MSKFEAQRRFIPNTFLLFLTACTGLERCPNVPFVERSVQIVERARMASHRAKDWRNQEIPAQKRERGCVSGVHCDNELADFGVGDLPLRVFVLGIFSVDAITVRLRFVIVTWRPRPSVGIIPANFSPADAALFGTLHFIGHLQSSLS